MKFTGLLKFWPPTPPRPEPPGVGWVKNKFYWFSGQFMTFPGLLIFWPPKIPTATPLWWGGRFFYRFSRQFMKFTGLFKFWPPTPPPRNPPGGMGKKTNFIDFLDSSWHFPEFWFVDPLKFPLRPPPPLGGEVYFFRQEPSPDLQGFMQVGKYDSIAHKV